MIVVNLWLPLDNDFMQGEYDLSLVSISNDTYDIHEDAKHITSCIEEKITPYDEVGTATDKIIVRECLYEIGLDRWTDEPQDYGFKIAYMRQIEVSEHGVRLPYFVK